MYATPSLPGDFELGPIAIVDGVLKGNTSGPFYSMTSNYDASCPCPCLTNEENLKRQCDKHRTGMDILISKLDCKAAELGRLTAYTDRYRECLDTIRIKDIDTLIRCPESEDEMETDLGSRQSFHCNKQESCVHRSSFDLYLQSRTAEWEFKSYCSLVIKHQGFYRISSIDIDANCLYVIIVRSIKNTTV